MSELVVYLDVAASEAEQVQAALEQIKAVPGVVTADVRLEEPERSFPVPDVASFTVTVTALAGAVGATAVLLDKVRDLVKSIRGLHQVLVETPEGPKPLDSVQATDFEND